MGAPDIFSVWGPLSKKYEYIGYETINCSTTHIDEIQNSIKCIVNIDRDDFFFKGYDFLGAPNVAGPQTVV